MFKRSIIFFSIVAILSFSSPIEELKSYDRFFFLTDSEKDLFINKLSLEDRVGQLFISVIYGDKLTGESKVFIDRTHIGNFILFPWADNCKSFEGVQSLTLDLKKYLLQLTHIPPFIATDQEGGRVSRLLQGFTSFPCNRTVATDFDISHAFFMGQKIGSEMHAAGVNMNLAPVVDICKDPSSWLFSRTYSDDPNVVFSFASEMIRGMHENKILVTLKHFPGHGNTRVNSHYNLPTIAKNLQELLSSDLKPFYLLKDKTDFIMTAHILCPYLDKDNPATFSKIILNDLLRDQFKYGGVILSDSLAMRSATPNQSTLEEAIESMTFAAIRAFNAGCDLMIVSKLEWADFSTTKEQDLFIIECVLKNFKNAVQRGMISEKKLNESVKRILNLKINLLLFD